MNISREQYHRFLTDQCSEEERLLLTSYFRQHPDILEHWLQAEDWEKLKDDRLLHPAFSDRMRNNLLDYINKQRIQRKRWYRVSAAAAILVLACSLLWLLREQPGGQPTIVHYKDIVDSTTLAWQDINNTTGKIMKVLPGDGSVIRLYGHSSLRYKKTLDSNRRDIYLQGVAVFDVAKDQHRPFTVYAGGVATTALGTSFKVTARKNDKNVKVNLYEGKLMVRADSTSVYLFPGDEVAMNAQGDFHKKVAGAWDTAVVKKNTPVAPGNTLIFNNTPLTEVLERLKQKFGADIRYNAGEIKTISVTATFTEQDALSDMLTILCTLNDLQLQTTGTTFAISR